MTALAAIRARLETLEYEHGYTDPVQDIRALLAEVDRLTRERDEAIKELAVATEAMDVQAHYHAVQRARAETAEAERDALAAQLADPRP